MLAHCPICVRVCAVQATQDVLIRQGEYLRLMLDESESAATGRMEASLKEQHALYLQCDEMLKRLQLQVDASDERWAPCCCGQRTGLGMSGHTRRRRRHQRRDHRTARTILAVFKNGAPGVFNYGVFNYGHPYGRCTDQENDAADSKW